MQHDARVEIFLETDRLVLIVAPEDSARTAALLSNSVDRIETPAVPGAP